MATTAARLHPDHRAELAVMIAATEATDGSAPLSEYKTMRLSGGLDVREHVLLDERGSLVGYGQAAWHGSKGAIGHWAMEIVADVSHRGIEDVGRLLEAMRSDLPGARCLIWARSDYVAAAAKVSGWEEERVLLEMRRPLPVGAMDLDLGEARLGTFRIGVDETAWLRINNAVFAGHPENGNMTRRDLERRIAQDWFDPAGFFLAWIEEDLVASCWTKLHEDGTGEIYIVGVAPEWEGRGLGKAMVAVGLDYLGSARFARQGMLFVEASNKRASGLYRKLGFKVVNEMSAYSYSPKA